MCNTLSHVISKIWEQKFDTQVSTEAVVSVEPFSGSSILIYVMLISGAYIEVYNNMMERNNLRNMLVC